MSSRRDGIGADFYRSRHLGMPEAQVAPTDPEQFCDELNELHADGRPWVLIGDGQHIQRDTADRVVLRTDELDGVLDFDPESSIIRVGAGMRWSQLQRAVEDRGFSLQRYDLHPPSATVGGILAKRQPGPPLLRGGALLDGCISIGAHSPDDGDYRYLRAPRKAAGPDLRHLFCGNEGRIGVILEATLVIWRSVAQRLLRWQKCDPAEAAEIVKTVFRAAITPAWVHYGLRGQSLQMALCAPGQLLRSRVQWISKSLRPPDEIGDDEAVQTRRKWLEARHPDRREHKKASNTRVVFIVPDSLSLGIEELFGPGVEDGEIIEWTPRRATAFVRYEHDVSGFDEFAPPARSIWAHWPLLNRPSHSPKE